ncbi:MAG: hypothetical protein PHX51_02575 [Clostridia bacterium]|nr:hypothetical protein [Clostridia bacterium]
MLDTNNYEHSSVILAVWRFIKQSKIKTHFLDLLLLFGAQSALKRAIEKPKQAITPVLALALTI